MILKLEDGRNELGFTNVAILIVITVKAGRLLEDMLVKSKYWTELSVKVETGQI